MSGLNVEAAALVGRLARAAKADQWHYFSGDVVIDDTFWHIVIAMADQALLRASLEEYLSAHPDPLNPSPNQENPR